MEVTLNSNRNKTRHTLDLTKVQQIDMKNGKKTSVKRSPSIPLAKHGTHHAPPHYFEGQRTS